MVELPYDIGILLLGIYPNEYQYVYTKSYTLTFIVTSFM